MLMSNTNLVPTYDVVVVGGGAAGLNGALVLARSRRTVLVIDAAEPRNAPAAGVHGFLTRDGTPPGHLLELGRAEVQGYGGQVRHGRVRAVTSDADGFRVTVDAQPAIRARRLLVTTGLVDELPDIAGLRERWGRDVLHCPYCHGWEVRDRPVGVLATGPASVEHAHLLRQWTEDVVLFTHTHPVSPAERAALGARGIAVVDGAVARLVVSDDRLRAVQLADGRAVPREALFIRPALRAHPAGPAAALGCELDADGLVRTDADGRTSVPGVWAAGNATNPRAQVITAAGEGSAVAIAINTDLVKQDVDAAVAAIAATAAA